MGIFFNLLLLLTGFVLLIKGADILVSGASSLARRYRIPELAIGLTIVAFGTSAPELVVNVLSSVNGHHDVVLGNIIGSNLFNLLAILGIAGVIYPLIVQTKTVWREIPYSLFAILALWFIGNDMLVFGAEGNIISRTEGVVLLLFFVAFIVYIAFNLKKEAVGEELATPLLPIKKTVLFILGGLGGLVIGGKLVVDNAVELAIMFGLSERMIALTIVAAGTSLPELATSAVASYRKQSDIAVGNIIGSNIFNIFLILGISAVISPLTFSTVFNYDIYVVIGATLFLFLAMFMGKKRIFDRWEAVVFLLAFLTYMTYAVVTAL